MVIASRVAWRAVVGTLALCVAALHAHGQETDPVGNLLRGMATSRDAARYASYPFSKVLGATDKYAPHDPGCVSGVLFGLFDASKGEAAR